MNEDQLYEIAKIIDNGYIGKRKSFKATKVRNCWHLTTNVCDDSYIIKVWERNNKISTVEVLGDDTDDWRSVTSATYSKINTYLQTLNLISYE